MKRNKRGFWLLAIFFFLWSVSVWGLLIVNDTLAPEQGQHSSMMGGSMSTMMKQHTPPPETLAELIRTTHEVNTVQNNGEEHHNSPGIMSSVHYLTTWLIFIACPLIFGGTAFIFISWIFS